MERRPAAEISDPSLEDMVTDAAPTQPKSDAAQSRPQQVEDNYAADNDYSAIEDYRALSTPAVAALALGLLSPLAFLDWWLGLIPLSGLIMGVAALRQIGRHGDEYTGRVLAIFGIVLAAVCWLGGAGRLGYIQATECPDGYDPIAYSILQPLSEEPPDRIPQEATALDGKKVFIKGYVYPGQKQDGITRFLLVRDQGTCCFGGNPKLTDRILVELSDPMGFRFSNGLFKVAGVFHVIAPTQAVDARGTVFYHLDQAMLR